MCTACNEDQCYSRRVSRRIFTVFIAIVMFCVIVVFLLTLFFNGKRTVEAKTTTLGLVVEYFPATNISRKYLLKMKNGYFGNEYATQKSEKVFRTFSAVESKPFHCQASCVCETRVKRRSVLAATRGAYVVLGAVSTAVAMLMAKDYFEDECRDIENWCEDFAKIEPNDIKCSEEEEEIDETENYVVEYECSGYCVFRKELNDPKIQKYIRKADEEDDELELNCEDHKMTKIVDVETHGFMLVESQGDLIEIAIINFREKHMKPFCRVINCYGYIEAEREDYDTGELEQFQQTRPLVCSEYDPDDVNIECLPIRWEVDKIPSIDEPVFY